MTENAEMGSDPVESLRSRLRGRVVAAALTPFSASGSVLRSEVAPYATAVAASGVGGLAVGAHTGRGSSLPATELAWLVGAFGAASGLPVIAGVAADPSDRDAALRTAESFVSAGAAGLLVYPMAGASPSETVALHSRLGSALGVPLVAFVLYERASGCQYSPSTVAELVSLPWVAGVKLALLDNAMGCQDIIAAARSAAPSTLVLTGEDRMYGPSMMWGADSALVGIASALPSWSVAVLSAWMAGSHSEFVAASARLDALAQLTFREPMEGYVQRMAWTAVWEGIMPEAAAYDPYGPPLPADERERLWKALETLQ
jgi:4-hydroxy-tetrahydrodipicolinate synthase